jgi:long-subunit acyl-CoA synthetase (AMP-forming)
MTIAALPTRLLDAPDQRLCLISSAGVEEARSFAALHDDVRLLQTQLRECGLVAGDFVGILGSNSYFWIVADLALAAMDCVSVALPVERSAGPLDTDALIDRYALSALLISDSLPAAQPRSPHAALLEERPISLVRRDVSCRPPLPQGVFSVAFSSGTAGTRKGLMISRAGLENTLALSARAWQLTNRDDILVAMPFSHLQQRYLVYLAIACGAAASIVPPERVFREMKVLSPTIVLGPPSFFEIVDNRLRAARRSKRLPYYLAVALHATLPRLSRPLRSRLGKRWLEMYGARARLLLVGSAPVSSRLLAVFQCLGAPLYQVYGMTEVGWIAFNLPSHNRIGSVGVPAEGVKVTLDDDGEIIAKSRAPQALGYIFDGVDTQDSVFLAEGQIATGDLGSLDKDGFLYLVGRKKNVIVTRSGVKLNPEPLERDIVRACPIKDAVVVATSQAPTLTCVVWLEDDEDLDRQHEVQEAIDHLNGLREPSHRIADVVFRPARELTAESGFLTRSMKINRAAVVQALQRPG